MHRARLAILVVQGDHQVSAFTVLLDGRVIYYRQVQLTVIVAVKQSNSATPHCLEDIAPVSAGIGHGRDANLRGNVSEEYAAVRRGVRFANLSFCGIARLGGKTRVLRG